MRNMRTFHKAWFGHVAVCFLAVLALTGSLSTLAADGENQIQSQAPNAGNCVLYNYNRSDKALTPTLYVWNEAAAATYRVYDGDGATAVLIGSARSQTQGSCCVVPLNADLLSTSSGTVYVSRQTDGEAESARTALSHTAASTPTVGFQVFEPKVAMQNGTEPLSQTYKGTQKSRPDQLAAGKYYMVDVVLSNFTKIQSLTLPIKYDPEILELTSLTYGTVNGVSGYRFGARVSADDGVLLGNFMIPANITSPTIVGGNPSYGIGVYPDLYNWGATQSTTNSSAWTQTPYVNTGTGLIKLEFSTENEPVDIRTLGGTTSSMRRIVRLYFKCLKKPTDTSASWAAAAKDTNSILHFATLADVPEGVTSLNEQQRYCHIASQYGYTASIQTMNLLAPPLSVSSDGLYSSENRTALTAADIYALPQSLSTADDRIRTMLENHAKVFNYTNYGDGRGLSLGTLDANYNDRFVLTPSNEENGAARQGDVINIYLPDGTRIAGPTTVDGEGGVAIDLGTINLLPGGGSVYVTVTRSGVESAKVEIPYAPEMHRDVYFKLNSSGFAGTDGAGLSNNQTVKAGDQIRVDIYFNNFDDLLVYTFNLRFNASVVQAADSRFHRMVQDGYISEESFNNDESCIKAGADLSGITFNEEMAYDCWKKYESGELSEAEVQSTMEALGIESLVRLEEIAHGVEVKYAFGENIAWNGGLLFTGPAREPGTNGAQDPGRDEDSLYPYVNNTTGTLRIASATLMHPPLVLQRAGDGYHFLTLYFVAVTSGDPGFEIKGVSGSRTNGVETVHSMDGTELVLSGPGDSDTTASTVCAASFTAHWQGYKMEEVEKTAVIKLAKGNANTEDQNAAALFLYNGYAFRDPGFTLQSADDSILVDTANGRVDADVVRYYMAAGVRHELPAWEAEETLYDYFVVPAGAHSATYDLCYEYTDTGGSTVQAVRKVYVIFMRGDINGDGEINLFDEQHLVTGKLSDDELYNNKTVLEQTALHNVLMGIDTIQQSYIMPVARSPDPLGEGSAATDAFRLKLEFYSGDADPAAAPTPLDPLALPAGQKVLAVVRYENLSALAGTGGGLANIGISLGYDPAHFTLLDFETLTEGVSQWSEAAQSLSLEWAGATSSLVTVITAVDATDQVLDDGSHRLYLQYINSLGTGLAFDADSGYLAAFAFRVAAPAFSDVDVCWLDHALTATDGKTGTTYDQRRLLNGETPFQKPQTVTTANAVVEGYAITGVVVSYNARNAMNFYLFAKTDGGEYATTASHSGVLIEAQDSTTGEMQYQTFAITGVENGSYKLVFTKAAHLNLAVFNVIVVDADVHLEDDIRQNVCQLMLRGGDINGDGTVNDVDQSYILEQYNQAVETKAQQQYDINGDGTINDIDQSIVLENYNTGEEKFYVDLMS